MMKDDDIRKVYEPLAKDHERLRAELMGALEEQAAPRQPQPQLSRVRSARGFAWAAVAASVVLALALLGVFGNGKHNVVWADVVESFKSVTFFHATLYQQEKAMAAPVKTDLWMGHGGKLRVSSGTQVGFGGNEQVAKYFDVKSRAECEPVELVGALLEEDVFGFQERLTLDAVIQMFGKNASVSPPIVNKEASISEDMIVFDVTTNRTSEVIRIWALRTSKLPVRIRTWDPRTGRSTEAFFSYAEPQPPEFFDAGEFEKALQDRDMRPGDLINALMKDPADRPVTGREAFEAAGGYHMPVIEQVGITEDGLVWVVASNAQNRMENGNAFVGFTQLTDDLGRKYDHITSGHTPDNVWSALFVPLDASGHAVDQREPKSLILTCGVPRKFTRRGEEPHVIGTRTVTEWTRSAEAPMNVLPEPDWSLEGFLRHKRISMFMRDENWEALEESLNETPGDPETSSEALSRERVRLSMYMRQHAYEKALNLAERLQPIYETQYVQWNGTSKSPYSFNTHIIALACVGRLDDAQNVFDRIKKLEPDIPPHLHINAQRKVKELNRKDFERNTEMLARDLSSIAHLTVDEIDTLLDVDIRNDELFDSFRGWDWSVEFKKPIYDSWRKHLTKLAEHYRSHPLPERMELLPVTDKNRDDFRASITFMPGITTHRVTFYNRSVASIARSMTGTVGREPGRWRIAPGLDVFKVAYDLVYAKDIPLIDQYRFVLDHVVKEFDLEIVDVIEPRKVWIARYDGRPLKPYRQVKAPVTKDEKGPYRTGMATGWGSCSMASLFQSFMYRRDPDGKANDILIIDETGIRSIPDKEGDWASVAVSCQNPLWTGERGPEMARKWFEEEFGVTFTEETRPITVHVVRKKEE